MHGDLDARADLVRFAVGVDHAWRAAFDDEACAAPTADVSALIEVAEEKPRGEGRGAEEAYGSDRDEIEHAIVDARARRDAGIVAVLIGVGDRDEEDFERFLAIARGDRDALGPQLADGGKRGARIGKPIACILDVGRDDLRKQPQRCGRAQ